MGWWWDDDDDWSSGEEEALSLDGLDPDVEQCLCGECSNCCDGALGDEVGNWW